MREIYALQEALARSVLLFAATAAFAVAAGKGHENNERLIGWKGEVHSVVDSIDKPIVGDRRQGCSSVNVGLERGFTPQRPDMQWLYRYPRDNSGPHYTHMAMITQLPNGTLLAAWQAAAGKEGTSDQHLVTCTSLDEAGRTWALPQKLQAVGDGKHPLWGPTFLVDTQRGALWLFYSQNSGPCKGGPMEWAPGGDVKAIRYSLHMEQWGQPKVLLSIDAEGGIPKVTANKALELSTGEFVLPFWRENALIGNTKPCKKLTGKGSAGVLISEDRGASWKAHGMLTTKGSWLIENAVTELPGSRLMMVFRTRIQRIYVSYSGDRGRSWSAAQPLSDLKNPNSKIDLVSLQPSGELALVFNDHVAPQKDAALSAAGCVKCRTHLKVAISRDGGATWQIMAELEHQVEPTLRIHYPTLQQQGCTLLVLYSQFHKIINKNDPSYADQGIKLRRISLSDHTTDHIADTHGDFI